MPAAPAPAAPAADAPAAANEPIGNVGTLTGTATVIRNKNSLPLQLQDDIFPDDTLRTSANSTLGVTFNDGTTFNLTANSRITVDSFIYEEGGKKNGALFDVARGTVAFVAASVAKTGDMRISTPTATLGIRGTTGLIEVPEGASATSAAGVNNVAIKLYPDADGRVGRIEISDRNGAELGTLTRGASGFAIRAGGGGGGARFAAVPLTISPREVERDQGFVRQVHAAQIVGRQIVTEQRDFRRANPGVPNPKSRQASGSGRRAAAERIAGTKPSRAAAGYSEPSRSAARRSESPWPAATTRPTEPTGSAAATGRTQSARITERIAARIATAAAGKAAARFAAAAGRLASGGPAAAIPYARAIRRNAVAAFAASCRSRARLATARIAKPAGIAAAPRTGSAKGRQAAEGAALDRF